ncbi:MAG: DUF4917 family protein [Solirubrobacterales bacterium]
MPQKQVPEPISFDEALAHSEEAGGPRRILLGNGFSVACRPDAFSYGRLFDTADFKGLSISADELFSREGTTDFEVVIEALKTAARIVEFYGESPDLASRLASDGEKIKLVLAETLAAKHPEFPASLTEAEYKSAREFLANFEKFYTVNYDLLLYWSLMHEDELGAPIESDDGFRSDPDDPDAPWVTWDPYRDVSQNVFFLHGGLHLFDAQDRLKKLTWSRTGEALVGQIREALDSSSYPVVVTEGTSAEKWTRIMHHPYLMAGFRSLARLAKGSLFIYGHSMAANDSHVFDAVVRGKIPQLYVGLYGDPESPANRAIQQRAQELSEVRQDLSPGSRRKPIALDVQFFDSGSATVWRSS